MTIVGLPDAAVQESRERVQTAIKNAGLHFPRHRIVVNLAPAPVRKEGPAYDLPIALGILLASGEFEADISGSVFYGELSLDGSVRHTNAILPLAFMAKEHHLKKLFIPAKHQRRWDLTARRSSRGISCLHPVR